MEWKSLKGHISVHPSSPQTNGNCQNLSIIPTEQWAVRLLAMLQFRLGALGLHESVMSSMRFMAKDTFGCRPQLSSPYHAPLFAMLCDLSSCSEGRKAAHSPMECWGTCWFSRKDVVKVVQAHVTCSLDVNPKLRVAGKTGFPRAGVSQRCHGTGRCCSHCIAVGGRGAGKQEFTLPIDGDLRGKLLPSPSLIVS